MSTKEPLKHQLLSMARLYKSAARGRADLLLACAAKVELAPALLGFDFVPTDCSAELKQIQEQTNKKMPAKTEHLRRSPLRMPRAYAVTEQAQEASAQSEASPLQWLAMECAEWDRYFTLEGSQALVCQPLWPDLADVRTWLDTVIAREPQGKIDWYRAAQRLAKGGVLQHLPRRARVAIASDVHLLIDGSAAFQALEGDARFLVRHLLQLCGGQLYVWRLPKGPNEKWQPIGAEGAKAPGHLFGSLLLVFSDLGVVSGNTSAWQQAIRGWVQQGAQLLVLFPGHRQELPTVLCQPAVCIEATALQSIVKKSNTDAASVVSDKADINTPLERLLQALSVTMWLDAPLIREVRQALLPESSPLLELQLMQHPSIFLRQVAFAQWRQGHRVAYQTKFYSDPFWTQDRVICLASILRTAHKHLSQALKDEELLDLAVTSQLTSKTMSWLDFDKIPDAVARVERMLARMRSEILFNSDAFVHSNWRDYLSARCARTSMVLAAQFPELYNKFSVVETLLSIPIGQIQQHSNPDPAYLDPTAPTVKHRQMWLCQDGVGIWLCPATNNKKSLAKVILHSTWVRGHWVKAIHDGKVLHNWPLHSISVPKLLLSHQQFDGALELEYHNGQMQSDITSNQLVHICPLNRPFADNFFERKSELLSSIKTPWGEQRMAADASKGAWLLQSGENEMPDNVSLWLDDKGIGMSIMLKIGMDLRLRYIPPGNFIKGAPQDIDMLNRGGFIQHLVTLNDGFWLAATPCSQALWQAVMGYNPSYFRKEKNAELLPVERVSYQDVWSFLRKLQTMLPSTVTASLPSDSEWEYACRAGEKTAYWWGDSFDSRLANTNYRTMDSLFGPKGTSSMHVYSANPWGLYDMHGNVWEMCTYDRYYDEISSDIQNLTMPIKQRFFLRGGSWLHPPTMARAWYRREKSIHEHSMDQGFRFVLRNVNYSDELHPELNQNVLIKNVYNPFTKGGL
ncbi:hypothetical protein Rhein_0199 [Rheinheimera sp. A13L]|uniref:formylglycine-generating enzyme family protein n=1 Tax=Rheinheimera sp. A13L TaxID=506534 RepID=UPI0002124CD2|nr:formylglycine-generating enzyme family protein [Rheinheimera sp. A13L]EGM79739.1 hypothetical protein Rhein_0199 [Rheinheimera sp. A13L]